MTESALVDVGWLFRQIGDEKLVVLDASVPPVVPGFVSINNEKNFTAIADARRLITTNRYANPTLRCRI